MALKTFFLSWGLVFFSALLDSYAAYVVKTKFNELGAIEYHSFSGFVDYIMKFVRSPWLLTALVAFVTAPALWFLALSKIDLSIAYPVLVGFHLLFILVFAIGMIGERMTVYKLIGTVLVLSSLYFFYKK